MLVVVWLAIAAVQLLQARRDAERGRATLEATRSGLSLDDLLDDDPEESPVEGLREARDHFRRARSRVRSPVVSPLRALPVVGRQLRSFDALAGGATEVTGVALGAVDEVQVLLDGGLPKGAERVALLDDLVAITRDADRRLREIDLGPDRALVGPLDDARREFSTELEDVRLLVTDAMAVSGGLRLMLDGQSSYLVLGANNAEMRAGSGMFLSAGILTIDDGELTLGDVEPTGELGLDPPGVPLPPDLEDLWGWTEPGREWRSLGLSPRFDVTAPVAAQMWEARTGQRVDGVLALDVIALRSLLAATGPVTVDGDEIGADGIVRELLHDQYVGLAGDGFDDAQAARRDRLGEVASATIDRLDDGDTDVETLAEELGNAGRGRHLLAWSSDPLVQQAWAGLRVTGELTYDSLSLAVLNRGGNKLDQFLQTSAVLTREETERGTELTVTVDLRNTVPPGEPRYIAGPSRNNPIPESSRYGHYYGLVALSVPAGATDLTVEGTDRFDVAGEDGPTVMGARTVSLPPGAQQRMTWRFTLPTGARSVVIEASARVPELEWRAFGADLEGDVRHRVDW